MNIAVPSVALLPFTEVEFEMCIFAETRTCVGIVQPSPRLTEGVVIVDFEVWIEPEFETALLDDDRIYRGTVQLPVSRVRSRLAGHGKDLTRLQLSLTEIFNRASVTDATTERVLGGQKDSTDGYVKTAHGWIEWHDVRRKRKNGKVWECKQYWLHWEEAGGRKRSKYIPKAKLADVEHCVYDLRKPIRETLQLLEKKR